MNILYEEDGNFKVGSIIADNTTSFQVESVSGKRSKVKANNVLLHFSQPALADFITQAETISSGIEVDFLWECCPPDEFGFEQIATEYFGHNPSSLEAAATLIRLHSAPIYFHRKGKGRYRAAPPEVLKAALAGAERKRQQLESQARYTEQLVRFELPSEFTENLAYILYKPDRNTVEVKALEAACTETHLSAAQLLQRCGALPSSEEFHLKRFLFEHFPKGIVLPSVEVNTWEKLPKAGVNAFSIDDATTTEIDDAFSVEKLATGNWRIGVHIAAPALGLPRGSAGDQIAADRLSTVYMPGNKITMLPENVVQAFTLSADRVCPALSMYIEVEQESLAILASESRVEEVHIATNLRHDELEPLFNEQTLAAGKLDYPYGNELKLLWELAQKLEASRGKPADNSTQQLDYTFHIKNDRVCIIQRKRGSPIDKVVSEMMILVNSAWGKYLNDHEYAGIYRTQSNGKVKMSTVAGPHQGLGVAQYLWSSSPLRRYVDLVNQRQIIALIREEAPVYPKNDTALYTTMRDFDTMYGIYGEFQRSMERYWCLRWLQQENIEQIDGVVLRENLVKFDGIPLVSRVSSLPETLPANTRVQLEIGEIDLLDLNLQTRFVATVEDEICQQV